MSLIHILMGIKSKTNPEGWEYEEYPVLLFAKFSKIAGVSDLMIEAREKYLESGKLQIVNLPKFKFLGGWVKIKFEVGEK